jgi:hypothetical protein
MYGSFHSTSGIAYPDDLKLLKQVFDHVCEVHGLGDNSNEAQSVAQAAMSLFSAGVFEEEQLTARLEEFVERRTVMWREQRARYPLPTSGLRRRL